MGLSRDFPSWPRHLRCSLVERRKGIQASLVSELRQKADLTKRHGTLCELEGGLSGLSFQSEKFALSDECRPISLVRIFEQRTFFQDSERTLSTLRTLLSQEESRLQERVGEMFTQYRELCVRSEKLFEFEEKARKLRNAELAYLQTSEEK